MSNRHDGKRQSPHPWAERFRQYPPALGKSVKAEGWPGGMDTAGID